MNAQAPLDLCPAVAAFAHSAIHQSVLREQGTCPLCGETAGSMVGTPWCFSCGRMIDPVPAPPCPFCVIHAT